MIIVMGLNNIPILTKNNIENISLSGRESSSARFENSVSFKIVPKAPPAPVINNIGAAAVIPSPIQPVNVSLLNFGKRKNESRKPINSAFIG